MDKHTNPELSHDARVYFRDDLRRARGKAFLDGERFSEIIFAIERLGSHLVPGKSGLDNFKDAIGDYALRSPVGPEPEIGDLEWHIHFDRLYDLVREGRNDALHQGAYARSLTDHAVRLSLLIEDGLMVDASAVGDFMVRDVSFALPWQPVSSIRQTMLVESFSYLPLRVEWEIPARWRVISDYHLAAFLRESTSNADRRRRLAMSVETAIKVGGLLASDAVTCRATETAKSVLERGDHRFLLVVHEQDSSRLAGVITPYDLV